MTTTHPTFEQTIYNEYRTAKRNLKKGRDFIDWMRIARGYDQARREAMHRAGANAPQGAAYRAEFARVDKRERLIDHYIDEAGKPKEFPTPEDRTYCIKVLENYDTPSHDPSRPPIKEWRDSLHPSERSKNSHPKRLWERYWAATAPQADKAMLAKLDAPSKEPSDIDWNPGDEAELRQNLSAAAVENQKLAAEIARLNTEIRRLTAENAELRARLGAMKMIDSQRPRREDNDADADLAALHGIELAGRGE